VLLEKLWKIAEKHSYDVSELMEPIGNFFQRLIMFMIDLLALYGIIKLHVNNFWPKLICLYALPIF
jgi:hypothetical protein